MADLPIGLPLLLGIVAIVALIALIQMQQEQWRQAGDTARSARRAADIRRQRARATAAIQQVTANRSIACTVVARVLARERLDDNQRRAALRAVTAEVDRINTTITTELHANGHNATYSPAFVNARLEQTARAALRLRQHSPRSDR